MLTSYFTISIYEFVGADKQTLEGYFIGSVF